MGFERVYQVGRVEQKVAGCIIEKLGT